MCFHSRRQNATLTLSRSRAATRSRHLMEPDNMNRPESLTRAVARRGATIQTVQGMAFPCAAPPQFGTALPAAWKGLSRLAARMLRELLSEHAMLSNDLQDMSQSCIAIVATTPKRGLQSWSSTGAVSHSVLDEGRSRLVSTSVAVSSFVQRCLCFLPEQAAPEDLLGLLRL